ncbi:hypothetical protein [Burkholderia multivorans]|uniref:hypothetical protein n=1 Tax=Burkholderia multivorans TaxID=87883 RepID=UPI00209CDE2D|nr:hypothetical protein [Burkholderia multivorans]MCO8315289.1 hypothetical protein [Burkholderia multivorans]
MSDFLNYTAGLHVLEKMGSQERVIDRQNQDLKKKNEAIGEANHRAGMAEAAEEFAQKEVQRLKKERDFYKDLLAKPFAEIAAQDGRFRETYEKQQEMLAEWVASQRAFKELAMKFGQQLGKSREEIIADVKAAKEIILNDQSEFGNNLNQAEKLALQRKKAREEKVTRSV